MFDFFNLGNEELKSGNRKEAQTLTHVKLASLELRIDRVRREPFAEDEKNF